MSYEYPETNYKPVTGPETFQYMVGFSQTETLDLLFLSTFDPNFHTVITIQDGVEKPLPDWEPEGFDPYRIRIATRKGLNQMGIEDDIIVSIIGIY